jgi:hypothetical protein
MAAVLMARHGKAFMLCAITALVAAFPSISGTVAKCSHCISYVCRCYLISILQKNLKMSYFSKIYQHKECSPSSTLNGVSVALTA